MYNSYFEKLDGSAEFYAIRNNSQVVFSIAIKLKDPVDRDRLEYSVDRSLLKYIGFKVCLEKGLMGYRFAKNEKEFLVNECKEYGKPIDLSKNNDYLLKVNYFNEFVYFTFNHILCDGTGGSSFVNEVLKHYKHNKSFSDENNTVVFEDAYNKYNDIKYVGISNKDKISKNNCVVFKTDDPTFKVKTITSSLEKFKNKCKTYECSVTALISSLVAHSVYSSVDKEKYLKISIPVNLRDRFESRTAYNFATSVDMNLFLDNKYNGLKTCSNYVGNKLKQAIKENNIVFEMKNANALGRPPFKYTPLFIKSQIVKNVSSSYEKINISNLGKIINTDIGIVDNVEFTVACLKSHPISIGVIYLGDNITITISFLKGNEQFVDTLISNINKLSLE